LCKKIFVSIIVIKNRRNFANRIKWEFQTNRHRLKFDELSGDPPRAWFHGALKVWKMVIIREWYIEHNNCYPP